jgi:transposase
VKYTQEQIKQISEGKPSDIAQFITSLLEHIEKLENRVQELERQVGTNSRNSSKPPSSDGLRKPKSLRVPGGKKGAPKGHAGHTLKMSETPDDIIWHEPKTCTNCGDSLHDVLGEGFQARQIVDLPVIKLLFTEHRAVSKCCPNCSQTQQASFPEYVKAPIQYGETWSAWSSYLHTYQHLPLDRITQFFEDLTGHCPSEGTLLSHLEKLSSQLEPIEKEMEKNLTESSVVHADESGMRVEGKLHWLHTVSNGHWTLYHVHPKRGRDAMDANGFLPDYQGTVVHDFWKSYFHDKYEFEHALCGVHLLRECQGIVDYDKHEWALKMQILLRDALQEKNKALGLGQPVSPQIILELETRYDDILREGAREWETPEKLDEPVKRGRKAKSKAANLAERFILYKSDILRFLRNELVPFDNNQAERDVRMVKVKQKVSGSFRTKEGADQFARIRGFISTARKQGRSVLGSIVSVIKGQFSFS